MTLHMNTFSRNGKLECQPRNIFHHRAFDLDTVYTFSTFGDSQDNNIMACWYNIFVATCNNHVPSSNRQSTQGATFVFNGNDPCNHIYLMYNPQSNTQLMRDLNFSCPFQNSTREETNNSFCKKLQSSLSLIMVSRIIRITCLIIENARTFPYVTSLIWHSKS